jgi:hypothetical protein
VEATQDKPTASASTMSAFVTMLYEPAATFRRLQAKPKGWLPMLVLMATTSVLMLWYFAVVDFTWLLDQMLASMKSAAEREQAAKFMSKNFLQGSSLVSTLVIFPVFFVIMGTYLMIVSKALSHGLSFGKSFSLAAWSSVPGILLLPLGAMQILLTSSGQLGFSDLNPVSLNQLIFHYGMADPRASLVDSLNVTSVWSTILMIIGFETWAQVKRSTAIMVVLIPSILVYGAWFAYAASKAT